MSTLRLYNSLTNKIEDFHPIKENEVSMYVCGPTVYNYPHIGNMRPVVVFDCLYRLLTYLGYKVTYVSNFTDIDDKIIKAAKENNCSEKEITDFYIKEFQKTVKNIGSLPPSITPRVTEYVSKIIDYISNLIKVDAAYESNGNVYFRVDSDKRYGSLSGINIESLLVGARIEENKEKESPLDFALWKKTDEGISWPSPWGNGRPGWHTECCVMIDTIFDNGMIDIHGGGYDLKFPHHENEIAQCEATHHNHIANMWMHNAFINVNNEKMSKSKGNFILAKDLIDEYSGEVVRMVILSTHYRQPVNFTSDTITSSQNEIKRIKQLLKTLSLYICVNNIDLNKYQQLEIDNFIDSLKDDLNTSNALSCLFDLIKVINTLLRNKNIDEKDIIIKTNSLLKMLEILGLNLTLNTFKEEDILLYKSYLKCKEEKDFSKSDEIRNELIRKGIL
ncbi:MAG: cysteine--tRNA ligase [Bacilli bacterium]